MALCWALSLWGLVLTNIRSTASSRRAFQRSLDQMRELHALEAKIQKSLDDMRDSRLRMREEITSWQIAAVRAVRQAWDR